MSKQQYFIFAGCCCLTALSLTNFLVSAQNVSSSSTVVPILTPNPPPDSNSSSAEKPKTADNNAAAPDQQQQQPMFQLQPIRVSVPNTHLDDMTNSEEFSTSSNIVNNRTLSNLSKKASRIYKYELDPLATFPQTVDIINNNNNNSEFFSSSTPSTVPSSSPSQHDEEARATVFDVSDSSSQFSSMPTQITSMSPLLTPAASHTNTRRRQYQPSPLKSRYGGGGYGGGGHDGDYYEDHPDGPIIRPNVPFITLMDVKCEPKAMLVHVEFDRPFHGIIYSKGHFQAHECNYVQGGGAGEKVFDFRISFEYCGTLGENPALYGDDERHDTFFENTVIIQFDSHIIEVWDLAKRLRCEWKSQYEKSVFVRPFAVAMLDPEVYKYNGDDIEAWMQINRGKGPYGEEVYGVVKIGEPLTIVIGINDHDKHFDMQVKDCFATDGFGRKVQLTDYYGCVVREKIMSPFSKIRNAGAQATVLAFASFQAFKFPDRMEVGIKCNIQICRHHCVAGCPKYAAAIEPHALPPYLEGKSSSSKSPSTTITIQHKKKVPHTFGGPVATSIVASPAHVDLNGDFPHERASAGEFRGEYDGDSNPAYGGQSTVLRKTIEITPRRSPSSVDNFRKSEQIMSEKLPFSTTTNENVKMFNEPGIFEGRLRSRRPSSDETLSKRAPNVMQIPANNFDSKIPPSYILQDPYKLPAYSGNNIYDQQPLGTNDGGGSGFDSEPPLPPMPPIPPGAPTPMMFGAFADQRIIGVSEPPPRASALTGNRIDGESVTVKISPKSSSMNDKLPKLEAYRRRRRALEEALAVHTMIFNDHDGDNFNNCGGENNNRTKPSRQARILDDNKPEFGMNAIIQVISPSDVQAETILSPVGARQRESESSFVRADALDTNVHSSSSNVCIGMTLFSVALSTLLVLLALMTTVATFFCVQVRRGRLIVDNGGGKNMDSTAAGGGISCVPNPILSSWCRFSGRFAAQTRKCREAQIDAITTTAAKSYSNFVFVPTTTAATAVPTAMQPSYSTSSRLSAAAAVNGLHRALPLVDACCGGSSVMDFPSSSSHSLMDSSDIKSCSSS